MVLNKFYEIKTTNQRTFKGKLIAFDKFFNISLFDCIEIINIKDKDKCINENCDVCSRGFKFWGVVNLLGKDIEEINEEKINI